MLNYARHQVYIPNYRTTAEVEESKSIDHTKYDYIFRDINETKLLILLDYLNQAHMAV